MTRTTNARIAGVAFLAYIAAAMTDMGLSGRVMSGEAVAVKLAGIAQHAAAIRTIVLLELVQCFCALVLAVTLYAITRVQDHDLAMLGMICRVCEGVFVALSVPTTLDLQWLATGADALDPAAGRALAAYLFRGGGGMAFTATFFAVGSTLFAWLLLRGRMVPVVLAWIGVAASLLVTICLPLQLAGFLSGPLTRWMWLPMFFFEVPLALWFLVKGVAAPHPANTA